MWITKTQRIVEKTQRLDSFNIVYLDYTEVKKDNEISYEQFSLHNLNKQQIKMILGALLKERNIQVDNSATYIDLSRKANPIIDSIIREWSKIK